MLLIFFQGVAKHPVRRKPKIRVLTTLISNIEGGRSMPSPTEITTAQLPMVPVASIPTSGHNSHSAWVTKQRPKVDRLACPWLIG